MDYNLYSELVEGVAKASAIALDKELTNFIDNREYIIGVDLANGKDNTGRVELKDIKC